MELRGMSTMVVVPPAAAARVAESNPSQSVRPGSFTWTWVSTRPGRTTRSPASTTGVSPVGSSAPVTSTTRPPATWIVAGRMPSGRTTRRPRTTRSATAQGLSDRAATSPPPERDGGGGEGDQRTDRDPVAETHEWRRALAEGDLGGVGTVVGDPGQPAPVRREHGRDAAQGGVHDGPPGLDRPYGGQAGVLGLGPRPLHGRGRGLEDEKVDAGPGMGAGEIREGRLEADQRADSQVGVAGPGAGSNQDGEGGSRPAIDLGGVGQTGDPAQQAAHRDVLAERHEAGLVVAAGDAVLVDEDRRLVQAAGPGAAIEVHQQRGVEVRREAGHPVDVFGALVGIEADAALAPDHERDILVLEHSGELLLDGEPVVRVADDARLHARDPHL